MKQNEKQRKYLYLNNFHSSDLQVAILRAYEKGYRITESGLLLNGKNEQMQLYRNIYLRGVPDLSKTHCVSFPSIFFASYCFYGMPTFGKYIEVTVLDGNISNLSKNNIFLKKKPLPATEDFKKWVHCFIPCQEEKKDKEIKNYLNLKINVEIVNEIIDYYKTSLLPNNKAPYCFYKILKSKYKLSYSIIKKITQD